MARTARSASRTRRTARRGSRRSDPVQRLTGLFRAFQRASRVQHVAQRRLLAALA